MTVHIFHKKRSFKSVIVEKVLLLRGTKREYSTIESMERLLEKRREEHEKGYMIKNVNFSCNISEHNFEGMQVFILNEQKSTNEKTIIYLHGGAWMNPPLSYHWKFMDKLAKTLRAKIIAPIYPKVTHFTHKDAYDKLLNFYKEIVNTMENREEIILMGDSSGGNIALGLAHLFKKNKLPQPKHIIIFSACVDMTFTNPEIDEYDKVDNMLSTGGIRVITKRWAAGKSLTDPIISPIYANLTGTGKISHFVGTHEILYPDAVKFDEVMTEQGVDITTYVYPKLSHVFLVMPIPEAEEAFQKVIDIIQDNAD